MKMEILLCWMKGRSKRDGGEINRRGERLKGEGEGQRASEE
jgi:hypothetical protein